MSLRGRLWPSLSTLCSHLARGGQRIQKDVYNTKGYYIRGEGALSVLLCFFLGLPTSLLHAGERFHWTELQLWGPAASEAFLCKEPYNKQPPPPKFWWNVASLLWLSNCSSLLIEAKANPAKKNFSQKSWQSWLVIYWWASCQIFKLEH